MLIQGNLICLDNISLLCTHISDRIDSVLLLALRTASSVDSFDCGDSQLLDWIQHQTEAMNMLKPQKFLILKIKDYSSRALGFKLGHKEDADWGAIVPG